MNWSQLKKRIESNFADSVRGRVEIWSTRYRKSHDSEGEAWITIDKQRVYSMGTYTFFQTLRRERDKRLNGSGYGFLLQDGLFKKPAEYMKSEAYAVRSNAWSDAFAFTRQMGVFPLEKVNAALFDYLNLSVEDAVKSDNPIIRALCILDRRFGRRRLKQFDDSNERPLVKTLYRFRCRVECIMA